MKKLKKILFVILALTLAFSLFACNGGKDPCKTHLDEDNDGKCDKCGETVEDGGASAGDVVLVDNGEVKFQIVYAKDTSADAMSMINKAKSDLLKVGLTVERVADRNDNIKECEVLIGNVAARGDKYMTDGHDYGMEGYVIKIVDSKIIINGGSDEAIIEAIEKFLEDIIEIEEKDKDFNNVVMSASQQVEEIQDNYKVTSLAVDGKDIKGGTISVNKANSYHANAAASIQSTVYERTGYWLEIVDKDKADDAAIVLKAVEKNAVEGGFKISANSKKQLLIECGYDNMLETTVDEFLSDKIVSAKGAVDFKGTVYTDDISVVYYKDFGAKGDGVTDDFIAIYEAHAFANISGQTVKATSGKTYYIHETRRGGAGSSPLTVSIRTNTIWTGAKFIIDDSDISTFDGTGRGNSHIFAVQQDTATRRITDKTLLQSVLSAGLNRETTKIDLGLNERVMIMPNNSSHRVFRHIGYSDYRGVTMYEVIIIDEDGNVDPETSLIFDYSNLDYINVYSLSDDPITIEGGEITTIASHIDIRYTQNGSTKYHDESISRGLHINRSNTTLKNVKHYITGEITLKEHAAGMIGPAYKGFYTLTNASHITLDGCVMTGRRCYAKPGGGTMGTYAITGMAVNKLVFKNCTQSNFWIVVDGDGNITPATEDTPGAQLSMAGSPYASGRMHWGCGGTNFCKNMEYYDSTLSRFDAHSGLYNGKIINCTINYIAITGVGEMLIQNTRWFAEADNYAGNSLIHLREDYGSTWEGKVIIDNMQAYVHTRGTADDNYSTTRAYLVYHKYNNWYFGYQACFPSLEINNLDYYDLKTRKALPAGLEVRLCDTSVTSERALHLEETLSKVPLYPYVDEDGDGYVDNTTTKYNKNYNRTGGIPGEGNKNVNPIKPPEIIKITNNDGVDIDKDGTPDGGYVFRVPNTAGYNVSDGGYYDEVDNKGGFFGDTKFYYGNGENDYYLGTNYVGQDTKTFIFK